MGDGCRREEWEECHHQSVETWRKEEWETRHRRSVQARRKEARASA